MRKIAVVCVFLAVLCGCQKKVVAVHPGAISNFDSYAYDLLLIEQESLNTAKAQFAAGSLPAEAKNPLNIAIAQYNITLAAWKAYHANGGEQTALEEALASLVGKMGDLEKAMGKKLLGRVLLDWSYA